MASLLMGIWGRFAGYLAMAAAVAAALFGVRYRIRKGAREDMENTMRERTIERIQQADGIEQRVDQASDDDIREKLRDNGWLR